MLMLIGVVAIVCAAGWFFASLSRDIMIFYIHEQGYEPPTQSDLKRISRIVTEKRLGFIARNKR